MALPRLYVQVQATRFLVKSGGDLVSASSNRQQLRAGQYLVQLIWFGYLLETSFSFLLTRFRRSRSSYRSIGGSVGRFLCGARDEAEHGARRRFPFALVRLQFAQLDAHSTHLAAVDCAPPPKKNENGIHRRLVNSGRSYGNGSTGLDPFIERKQ